MTTGEKISKLRKESNYTQEQFADFMDVSRQSVSKWEQNLSYPETEKLLKMCTLFRCTTDYLLKDEIEEPSAAPLPSDGQGGINISLAFGNIFYEKKSSKMVGNLPLWHINIGPGRVAKGIFAIGTTAKGIFSVGLLSMGIFSAGVLSLGVVSVGVLSLALIAAGTIAIGLMSFGAISFGLLATGAVAVGLFSQGALAMGTYFAHGDTARGMFAFADTNAIGTAFEHVGALTDADKAAALQLVQSNVPEFLRGITEWFINGVG